MRKGLPFKGKTLSRSVSHAEPPAEPKCRSVRIFRRPLAEAGVSSGAVIGEGVGMEEQNDALNRRTSIRLLPHFLFMTEGSPRPRRRRRTHNAPPTMATRTSRISTSGTCPIFRNLPKLFVHVAGPTAFCRVVGPGRPGRDGATGLRLVQSLFLTSLDGERAFGPGTQRWCPNRAQWSVARAQISTDLAHIILVSSIPRGHNPRDQLLVTRVPMGSPSR